MKKVTLFRSRLAMTGTISVLEDALKNHHLDPSGIPRYGTFDGKKRAYWTGEVTDDVLANLLRTPDLSISIDGGPEIDFWDVEHDDIAPGIPAIADALNQEKIACYDMDRFDQHLASESADLPFRHDTRKSPKDTHAYYESMKAQYPAAYAYVRSLKKIATL